MASGAPHPPREEDFAVEPAGLDEPGIVPFVKERYDPAADREKKRGRIALTLVYLLCAVVLASFSYAFYRPADIDALKALLEIVFAPVVGLVGAATGFYFGEKAAR